MRVCFLALLLPMTAFAWEDNYENQRQYSHDYESHDPSGRRVVIVEREDTWGNLAEIEQRNAELQAQKSRDSFRDLLETYRTREELRQLRLNQLSGR